MNKEEFEFRKAVTEGLEGDTIALIDVSFEFELEGLRIPDSVHKGVEGVT